jgi:hypothetical protein
MDIGVMFIAAGKPRDHVLVLAKPLTPVVSTKQTNKKRDPNLDAARSGLSKMALGTGPATVFSFAGGRTRKQHRRAGRGKRLLRRRRVKKKKKKKTKRNSFERTFRKQL